MAGARGVINHNVTAMRAEPERRSEQVSQAIFGETVALRGDQGDFTEVQSPDSYQGWVLTRHITILETGERYPNPARAAMVAPLFLPVFREPSSRSERLTLFTLGTAVELAQGDAESDFFPVRFPDGRIGHVESGALIVPTYPAAETIGPNLVVVGRGMIGVPYLWGGRTPFGIDCSGFAQRVYWLCGHVIPRDAYQQARSDLFRPVDRQDLMPGDLVFFAGSSDPRRRGITHVGIAQGDGRFLHASSANGVGINSLADDPYDREYHSAARLKS